MKRPAIGVALTIALVLCAGVGTAEAQWWRGWLDRLSGPGPFDGWGVQVEFLCYGEKEFARTSPAAQVGSDGTERSFFPDVSCSRANQRSWRAVIGIDVGWYEADDTGDLVFDHDYTDDEKEVDLLTVGATIDFMRHPSVELGANVGIARFDGQLFGSITRFLVEPRMTVKPLAAFSDSRWARVPQIRGRVTVLPGGFEADDFGAVPGSWRVGTEWLPGWQIVLDFGELLGPR